MKYTIKRKMIVEQEITIHNKKLTDNDITNIVNNEVDLYSFGKYSENNNLFEMEFQSITEISDDNGNILY
jgi:hypothetical protein